MKKKTLSVAAAALAAVMLATGCSQTTSSVASSAAASSEVASSVAESTVSSAEETAYPLTLQIYDADGNAVDMTYDHAPEKVLSTQLSMTELLIKLGLKDKIVGVFDNDNALKGDIADEIASLNSLGDKKSVSKETILATEPDLILGKGPLMFTESSIGTVQSYQELGMVDFLAHGVDGLCGIEINRIVHGRYLLNFCKIKDPIGSYRFMRCQRSLPR